MSDWRDDYRERFEESRRKDPPMGVPRVPASTSTRLTEGTPCPSCGYRLFAEQGCPICGGDEEAARDPYPQSRGERAVDNIGAEVTPEAPAREVVGWICGPGRRGNRCHPVYADEMMSLEEAKRILFPPKQQELDLGA